MTGTLAARERLAQTLIPVAAELAATVRDYGPDDVAAVLTRVDPEALPALAVVLAAMVDVERTPRELLAWMDRTAAPLERDRPPARHLLPEVTAARDSTPTELQRARRAYVRGSTAPADRAGYVEAERRRRERSAA